jgi:thiamine monophosphate synthase
VCREDDALLIVADRAETAAAVGADGLHLSGGGPEIGMARVVMGGDALVGMTSRTVEEAGLALEVGADYLLHYGGTECPAVFAGLGRSAGVPLFAAGLDGLEDARRIVEAGIYRLCVDGDRIGQGDTTEALAEYSRVLGRSM